jgi:hypothetical protein
MSDRHDTPRARTSGLVVKAVADEVLVYDLDRHRAHSLNRAAAAVWRRLDGRTSVTELARRLHEDLGTPADESTVWLALKELDRAHLLEAPLRVPAVQGLSRRQWLRRVGVAAGASAVLVPTVSSVVAPHAYAQASGCANPSCPEFVLCPNTQCPCVTTTEGTACIELCLASPDFCTGTGDCPSGAVCVPLECFGVPCNACLPQCGRTDVCLSGLAGTLPRLSRLARRQG